MLNYKITIQLGRNVKNAGTERESVGSEFVHSIVITASEDSAWFSFERAKEAAIGFIKRTIATLSAQKADSHELKLTKMKLKRIGNLMQEDILYLVKKGQNSISL